MGGVPLLLLAVTMGITYGWQPDGAGGVNYIIQVPPDQIDAVRRSGEITSVIDPAVRGHVSRIILRVGEGPLPRDTPANLAAERGLTHEVVQASVDDHAPIESPTLPVESSAVAARSQTTTILMKPQTGAANGMALPPTLAEAGADAASRPGFPNDMADLSAELAQRQRNEQRQNSAAAGASGGIDELMRGALGASGNRNNDSQFTAAGNGQAGGARATGNTRPALPPFTAGDSVAPIARVRTDGPTTEATNTRDNTWFQMNAKTGGVSTDPITPQAPWPDMVGPPDPRRNQGSANTNRQQPIGSTSNFAHVPGGISLPSNGGTASQGQATNLAANERAEYLRRLQLQQGNQNPEAQQNANAITNYPNTFGQNGGAGNLATNASSGNSMQPYPNRGNPAMNAQDPRRLQFDPRLTPAEIAQLPYGAWSLDQYGNPTDRDGRILDQHGRPVSQQRAYELTVGRANATATVQPQFPDLRSPVNGGASQQGFTTTGFNDRERIAQRDSIEQYNRQRGNLPATGPPPLTSTVSTNSPSDRQPPDYRSAGLPPRESSEDSVAPKRRQTLAAQPMFNGLLLMSIVANVYLIFWLKNLRHQFHDLVASKRAATSDISG
jgi:hypothetical protein